MQPQSHVVPGVQVPEGSHNGTGASVEASPSARQGSHEGPEELFSQAKVATTNPATVRNAGPCAHRRLFMRVRRIGTRLRCSLGHVRSVRGRIRGTRIVNGLAAREPEGPRVPIHRGPKLPSRAGAGTHESCRRCARRRRSGAVGVAAARRRVRKGAAAAVERTRRAARVLVDAVGQRAGFRRTLWARLGRAGGDDHGNNRDSHDIRRETPIRVRHWPHRVVRQLQHRVPRARPPRPKHPPRWRVSSRRRGPSGPQAASPLRLVHTLGENSVAWTERGP